MDFVPKLIKSNKIITIKIAKKSKFMILLNTCLAIKIKKIRKTSFFEAGVTLPPLYLFPPSEAEK